jgi:hypothetical protein
MATLLFRECYSKYIDPHEPYIYLPGVMPESGSLTLPSLLNASRGKEVTLFEDKLREISALYDLNETPVATHLLLLHITLGVKQIMPRLVKLKNVEGHEKADDVLNKISKTDIGLLHNLPHDIKLSCHTSAAFSLYIPHYDRLNNTLLCSTKLQTNNLGIWALPFIREHTKDGIIDTRLGIFVYDSSEPIRVGTMGALPSVKECFKYK